MELYVYQIEAHRTMPYGLAFDQQVTMLALGIAGETGEIVDVVKKQLYHGHDDGALALEEEIGDLLWYLANLASLFDIPFPDSMPPADGWEQADIADLALELADMSGSIARFVGAADLIDVYRDMGQATRYISNLIPHFLQVMSTLGAVKAMALSAIAGRNIQKLRDRYPEGFSQNRSKLRREWR